MKLLKKKFGSSKLDTLFEFTHESNVKDICLVDDIGYVFSSGNCLGIIGFDGKLTYPWMGINSGEDVRDGDFNSVIFKNPTSLAYHKKKKYLYLVEDGGTQIREIDVELRSSSMLLKYTDKDTMMKYFSGNSRSYNRCDIAISNDHIIYWTIGALNRVFKIEFSNFLPVIGNGQQGYSVTSNVKDNAFNTPSGIACSDKSVYIVDTFNSCIRRLDYKIGKGYSVSLVAGKPCCKGDSDDIGHCCRLISPTKLVIKNKFGYFIDHNKVKSLALTNYDVRCMYESDKLVSIDMNEAKDLLILEK